FRGIVRLAAQWPPQRDGCCCLGSCRFSSGWGYSMSDFFRRCLVSYAEYHRDERNCLMHLIGNPILAVAAFLPFSLVPVTVFGLDPNAATGLCLRALRFVRALVSSVVL